jgi:hypothetical protein
MYEHTSRFEMYPFINYSLLRRVKMPPFHFASFSVHLNFYPKQEQDVSLETRVRYLGIGPNNILLRVRGSVTNNNRFWIGWLDLFTACFTITLNYNQLEQLTIDDCLTRPIPYWTTSVFYCDWLDSDLRIDHFFYEWRITNDLLFMTQSVQSQGQSQS